jgi:hypothetical protein
MKQSSAAPFQAGFARGRCRLVPERRPVGPLCRDRRSDGIIASSGKREPLGTVAAKRYQLFVVYSGLRLGGNCRLATVGNASMHGWAQNWAQSVSALIADSR